MKIRAEEASGVHGWGIVLNKQVRLRNLEKLKFVQSSEESVFQAKGITR